MDDMDGLAGWLLGMWNMRSLPGRIFMGDSGSVTLGMLAAAFSLWGVHDHVFPIWFPVLVFSPLIVDATITLIRRALRRGKVW